MLDTGIYKTFIPISMTIQLLVWIYTNFGGDLKNVWGYTLTEKVLKDRFGTLSVSGLLIFIEG